MYRGRYLVTLVSEAHQDLTLDDAQGTVVSKGSPDIGWPLQIIVQDTKTGDSYAIEAEQYYQGAHIYNAVKELADSIEAEEKQLVE